MTVGPRIAMITAVLTLVVGVLGLIVTLALGAFVFDDYDAYGEVPVPGIGRVTLPAGEVTISFHTAVTGGVNGGFPVPPLKLGIDPPEGVPDPVISETIGTTTSVNNDVHLRIWVAQIPQAGVYEVRAGGDVGGYINPRLSFGRDSSPGWPLWVFGALTALGMVELTAAITWRVRSGRRARPVPGPVILDEPSWRGPVPPPVHSYQPGDEGVRLEQLKTLAALRDSGALSDAEFEAEKRRILGGQ
jgi:hypothetical protein